MPELNFMIRIQVIISFCAFQKESANIVLLELAT